MGPYIKNNKGMISVESLIVFPLTLMILFVFVAYMFLEFERSNIILSSNMITLDILSKDKGKNYEDDYLKIKLIESPLTRSLDIEHEVVFTSDIIPNWGKVDIKYKNKSTDYKKFNILVLKGALYDAFVDEGGGEKN